MLPIFLKGGPLMWPLLVASLVALTTVFERTIAYYRDHTKQNRGDAHAMLRDLKENNISAAISRGEKSHSMTARCLTGALRVHEGSFAAAYQQGAARELRHLSRGLPTLDTVITLAPLMGLLGTVTGMIHAFGLMGGNELQAPAAITGGVAEALIATAFGLAIAICTLVPFNWLHAHVEKAQHELQDIGSQAEILLQHRPFVERRQVVREPALFASR